MTHGIAREQLLSIVERVERLTEERDAIGADIKDVLQEAKSNGLDPKIIKKVISIRKRDKDEVSEEEMILHTYLVSLGYRQGELFEEAA